MSETVIVALIVVFSNLTVLIIKEIFDARKIKNEQEYLHKKDFLAIRREKAEDILKGIQIYMDIIDEQIVQIQYKNIDWSKQSSKYIEKKFQGQKEKIAINLSLYFPLLDKKYLDYTVHAVKLNNLIANITKERKYTNEEIKNLNLYYRNFQKCKLSLTDILVKEIRNGYNKLI